MQVNRRMFPLKNERNRKTSIEMYYMVVDGLIPPNLKASQAYTNPKHGNRELGVEEKHWESG